MIICGIDYSMTSPCLCLHNTETEFTFENCQFFYLTNLKYLDGKQLDNVFGRYFDKNDYPDDISRFGKITGWACKNMREAFDRMPDYVSIEGYAMGARGKVFHIGENTGILKHALYKLAIPYIIYSPKTIKMFAVNNSPIDFSNVNKNKIQKNEMHDIFLEECDVNLHEMLTPKKKNVDSPVSDIIDSYYICKHLYEDIKNGEIEKEKA